MTTFTIKVPNDDEGEDLGYYDAPAVPRVGETFLLFHPKLTGSSDHPFVGTVVDVVYEAMHPEHKFAKKRGVHPVDSVMQSRPIDAYVVVWLQEEAGATKIWCDCTPNERELHGIGEDGDCANCGHERAR